MGLVHDLYSRMLNSYFKFKDKYVVRSFVANNDPISVRNFTQIGSQGNLWDNESTGAGVPSNVVDTENYPHISIFGETREVTDFSVYVSVDGVNFYLCEDLSTKVNAPTGFTFHIYFTAGARYFYLSSSADVIATASVVCKP